MLIIQNTEHFRIESPTIVTIGTFDGVHLGHQKILERLKELKEKTGLKTVVLTFEPHPRKVLFPEQKDLKLITLIDEKLELLDEYGVDVTVVYPFTKRFSETDSPFYIEEVLLRSLKVQYLVIGYDHKFGKNRSGDINSLKELATQGKFLVEEISARDIDHIAISSSKIRKALDEGNVEHAKDFLGHPFSLTGEVVQGKQLGRTLGYPTANIKPEGEEKIIPKTGVYFVEVFISEVKYFGMMSIGINPTTDSDNKVKLEVNIFNFNEDIYGKVIKLNFLKRLRDEKKFANLTELKKGIDLDKETSLKLIPAYS
ncbi:bifunctional riboflavin kinase/FAD synthetase [Aurantibacillus circumpalustris]|uniref:bifunctional riboflavin kinase/FAD synthetase n=1 Tax=Aurantibacillus circumpalustris TaxID=3036359 RepID=UPI00295BB2F4|nr:bifunctional riboflavin kinase/FAD synthetase [Aurantibacillus circumpalustris]